MTGGREKKKGSRIQGAEGSSEKQTTACGKPEHPLIIK